MRNLDDEVWSIIKPIFEQIEKIDIANRKEVPMKLIKKWLYTANFTISGTTLRQVLMRLYFSGKLRESTDGNKLVYRTW